MKKFMFIFFMTVLALTVSACTGSGDVVKIGVIGPLTGELSIYGSAVENGAKLAAKEINAAGGLLGKDIEIIAYDTEGDNEKAVNAYNRLVDQDEVVAIVGGTLSGSTLSFKDLAVADGIPLLTPTATNPDVTLNAPNIFRACYTDSYQGTVAALFAMDDLAAEKAAAKKAIMRECGIHVVDSPAGIGAMMADVLK